MGIQLHNKTDKTLIVELAERTGEEDYDTAETEIEAGKSADIEHFSYIAIKEKKIEKGKCFNKERIKNLKEKWQEYNLSWSDDKNNIPKELYELIEEIIERLENAN